MLRTRIDRLSHEAFNRESHASRPSTRKRSFQCLNAIPSTRAAPSDRSQQDSKGNSVRLRPVSSAIEEERRRSSDWVFSPKGQRQWVDSMELGNTGPEMAAVLQEMGVRYNPRRLANALRGRNVEISTRAVRITYTLGKFIFALAQDYATGQLEKRQEQRAGELRQLLGQLGPSFVKVGQALSARPDLLPQVYLEALSELQDRLPPFPTEVALEVMEAELKRPIFDVYSDLTPQPVAAASLGQVYKGRLRSNGKQVAVKVQRPEISENIAIDMLLLRRFMKLVDAQLPSLIDIPLQPLLPLVDEFAGRLFAELDYVQEGRNAERFESLYGMIPRVKVPKIYWGGLTTRRVLTMEWINGVKLTDTKAMTARGLRIVDFVDVGIECSLRQLLAENGGFFHADPHPGNLLATYDGQLAYLDFGMMSEAPQYARYAIIGHVTHLVNRDYEAMARDYYTLQFMDRSVDTSPIAPALANFFDDVLNQSIAKLNFKAIVDGLGNVLFKYPFRVPAYYALILRSLTVLEGLALQADKDYKLLAKAYPYMAKRLLTDPSPELREYFRELILDPNGRLRWGRLEDLIEEGSKSVDYDPQQLWLLAAWVLGEEGGAVRAPLVDELVRLMDSAVASEFRSRITQQTSRPELADRLVPEHTGDLRYANRARVLFGSLFRDIPSDSFLPKGSGLLGLPMPQDVQKVVNQLEVRLGKSWPQIQQLLTLPGAVDARAQLMAGLMQRASARFAKLIFGPTQQKKRPGQQIDPQPGYQLSQQRAEPPFLGNPRPGTSPSGASLRRLPS